VDGERGRAQPRHHRPVGQRALGRIGAGLGGGGPAPGAPGPQLLHQPGLAGAGLAGDQRQLGGAALASPPQVDQARPLAGPPDQGRGAGRAERARLVGGGGLDPGGQQRRVGPAGGRRRLDAELAGEGGRAGVVDAQRPRPVPAGVVQPHQGLVGRLAQRVLAQEPLGAPGRRREVAPGLQQLDQPLQGLEVALAEPLPLLGQPLVVAALEQVARVQLDGLAQGGLRPAGLALRPGHGGVEGGHVQPAGGVGPPPERPRRHLQEPVGLQKGAPQDVQQVP
jgi:hypothetical protein